MKDLDKKEYYEIAKLIDNDYTGQFDFFNVEYFKDYTLLSTTKCDSTSFIRIYPTRNHTKIERITRIGPDTDESYGWLEILPKTMERIRSRNIR